MRAIIRPGQREELPKLVQAASFPADLRKVMANGRHEGDICYFFFGGFLGTPWEAHKPWIDQHFEVEWVAAQAEVDKDELTRIARLQSTKRKLGFEGGR